jgi:hypothetical protein
MTNKGASEKCGYRALVVATAASTVAAARRTTDPANQRARTKTGRSAGAS